MGDDAAAKIEAEQSMLSRFIEESKRLCARSDVLMNAARSRGSKEAEGETEDA
jgi:hypothetical protein